MSIFGHLRAVSEGEKSAAVKKLIEASTPNFDFFLLIILSVLMATFGLLEDSPSVVIGSMLIAPVLFPILSLSASVVMSDYGLIQRASVTMLKALILGVATSTVATLFFGLGRGLTSEVLLRTEPTLISIAIAMVAGFAVAYALLKESLNTTLPGVVVAVALIPPLATIGVGLANLNWSVVAGASVFLGVNVVGIVFASMFVFSIMNLYIKRDIAVRAATKADEKAVKEAEEAKEATSPNA